MLIPVLGTAGVFFWLVQPASSSTRPEKNPQPYLSFLSRALRHTSMYWLCGLYGVTFGGFVGLSSYLPIFFHDQFQLEMVTAGTLTAISALAGSVARPVGGFLADRMGGFILLQGLFVIVTILCLASGQFPTIMGALAMVFGIMLCLGFGNGVVFQVVSCRFQGMMGTASGLIGAAGGLGGFLLPTGFGWLKDMTGTFTSGFLALGCVSALAALSVMIVQRSDRLSTPTSTSGN
jgi:NNP family nitrate/nitrite transporter-like MFS transporter